MDFSLSEESRMLQEMVRSFAEEKLKPRAVEIDETCCFPWDSWREMGELGLLGMLVPEHYGGPEMTNLDYMTALEEISVGCAATAAAMSVQNSLAIFPIQSFGTDAQKERYLPKLASGEWVGCYGLTEPGAGSDAASLKTSCQSLPPWMTARRRRSTSTSASSAARRKAGTPPKPVRLTCPMSVRARAPA